MVRVKGPLEVLAERNGWVHVRRRWRNGSVLHAPPRVKLTIRRNAPIAAAPRGVVWARIGRRVELTALAILRADGWVRIADVPGLPAGPCSDHDRIWVHRRYVIWK